ncbi:MAG: hypothetical protein PVF75_06515 [Granulosicoccaceae bacterium]|jgi:hypothetical protein
MPSLSLIEAEAQRLVGRLPEERRLSLQTALVDLCETHWQEVRGPEPTTPLARALWSVTPPLADLLIDLYVAGDARLDEALPASNVAKGMALLVLAEIEHGDEAGVHLAHEPMMAFEMAPPPSSWLERIAALLHGKLEAPALHPHDHHTSLWKALAVMAAHSKRLDLPAMLQVIGLLASPVEQLASSRDEALAQLRHDVDEAGIRFVSVEDDHIAFEQHGHAHKPVRARQVAEMLLEIRQQWLG